MQARTARRIAAPCAFACALAPLLIAGRGGGPAPARELRRVTVEQTFAGCWQDEQKSDLWTREGGALVCGGRELSLAAAEELRDRIVALAALPRAQLAGAGLTEERFRDELAAALGAGAAPVGPAPRLDELPEYLRRLLRLEVLAPVLWARLVAADSWSVFPTVFGPQWPRVAVTFEGSPEVHVYGARSAALGPDGCEDDRPLYWRVRVDEGPSIAVPHTVAVLLTPIVGESGPCAPFVSRDAGRPPRWDARNRLQASDWMGELAPLVDAARRGWCGQLPGHADFAARFELVEVALPRMDPLYPGALDPRSMSWTACPRRAGTIDALRWLGEGDGGTNAPLDWERVLAEADEAWTAVEAQGWLARWKSAGGERALRVVLAGNQRVGPAAEDARERLLRTWRRAGLPGAGRIAGIAPRRVAPTLELELLRDGAVCARLHLASDGSAGLFSYATPDCGIEGLDARALDLHGDAREGAVHYGISAPDGAVDVLER